MSIGNGEIYYVNSEYKSSGTDSNFKYEINIPQNENYDRVCVLQASIPMSFYLVRDGMNSFTMVEFGIEKVVSIPIGNYNYQTFQTAALSAMNDAATTGWVYSVSFSSSTGKYTWKVTGNSGQPSFIFDGHLSQQFGFNQISTNVFTSDVLVSTNSVNFIPEPTIYIHSDICVGKTDILQEIYSNNTMTFSQIIYQLKTSVDAYAKKLRTTGNNTFTFFITDADNHELNTNGQKILLTILLYKKDDFSDVFKKYISWAVQKQQDLEEKQQDIEKISIEQNDNQLVNDSEN